MLIVEQVERQWLADRTGLVTAGYLSGNEFTPQTWAEQLNEFDAWLVRTPEPVVPLTERERKNEAFRRALGVAA